MLLPDDLLRRIAEDAVSEVVGTIDETVTGIWEGPRSGRQYPGLPNRSSAPGEPAAVQSGRARDERTVIARGLKGEITWTAPYVGFLEFGTSKMAARSVVKPALERLTQNADLLRRLTG